MRVINAIRKLSYGQKCINIGTRTVQNIKIRNVDGHNHHFQSFSSLEARAAIEFHLNGTTITEGISKYDVVTDSNMFRRSSLLV